MFLVRKAKRRLAAIAAYAFLIATAWPASLKGRSRTTLATEEATGTSHTLVIGLGGRALTTVTVSSAFPFVHFLGLGVAAPATEPMAYVLSMPAAQQTARGPQQAKVSPQFRCGSCGGTTSTKTSATSAGATCKNPTSSPAAPPATSQTRTNSTCTTAPCSHTVTYPPTTGPATFPTTTGFGGGGGGTFPSTCMGFAVNTPCFPVE